MLLKLTVFFYSTIKTYFILQALKLKLTYSAARQLTIYILLFSWSDSEQLVKEGQLLRATGNHNFINQMHVDSRLCLHNKLSGRDRPAYHTLPCACKKNAAACLPRKKLKEPSTLSLAVASFCYPFCYSIIATEQKQFNSQRKKIGTELLVQLEPSQTNRFLSRNLQ